MKRPCFLRRRWPWLALPFVPMLAWGVILVVVPTDWARTRMVDRLTRATGRSVRIGSLKLGFLGDLRIMDLSIAENHSATDPWLKVAEARIDVHLGQILTGHCEPSEIHVDGPWLRIWRKADGTVEMIDLLRDGSKSVKGRGHAASTGSGPSIALKVTNGQLRIIDDPSGTVLDLENVSGNGTCGKRLATIEELRGTLNTGKFVMAAKLDRDPASPRFEAEVQASGVEIDRGMPVLGFFVPVVAGATDGVGGRVDLMLKLNGQGTTRAEVRRTLRGQGSVILDPVDLEGSKFLAQLNVLGDWPRESRIGSVSTDFVVENGRITTEDLTIRVSRFPFVLDGWTDFDGRFDYRTRVDRITAQLPREAKGWLASDLKVSFEQLAGLRMYGSINKIDVTVNGQPLTGDPDRPNAERARFRETARQIRDRFFR
jgi:AsmA-like C-terminal region